MTETDNEVLCQGCRKFVPQTRTYVTKEGAMEICPECLLKKADSFKFDGEIAVTEAVLLAEYKRAGGKAKI